jgi:chromobox protein 5
MYAVEEVLKRRTKGGKVQYFVKWVGYDHSHDTWEPEENFRKVRASK